MEHGRNYYKTRASSLKSRTGSPSNARFVHTAFCAIMILPFDQIVTTLSHNMVLLQNTTQSNAYYYDYLVNNNNIKIITI